VCALSTHLMYFKVNLIDSRITIAYVTLFCFMNSFTSSKKSFYSVFKLN